MSETSKALHAEMNRNIQLQEEIERLKELLKRNEIWRKNTEAYILEQLKKSKKVEEILNELDTRTT